MAQPFVGNLSYHQPMKLLVFATFLMAQVIICACNPLDSSNGSDSNASMATYAALNPMISSVILSSQRTGAVSPLNSFQDDIAISNKSFSLKRTGGAGVMAGSWIIALSPDEVREMNALIANISAIDADILNDSPPIGGGTGFIFLGDQLKFYNGISGNAGDSKYHTYSAKIQLLSDKMNLIINSRGYAVSYISNS